MKPIEYKNMPFNLPEDASDVADAMRAFDDCWENYADNGKELREIALGESEKYELVCIGTVWAFHEQADIDEKIGEYYADETGELNNLPERLQRYFDYAAYGRDIRLEGADQYWVVKDPALVDSTESLGQVWVLRAL